MKKGIILIVSLLILGLYFSSADAEISADDITINPSEPTELSDVSISCIISDLGGDASVYLWVEECNENLGICDPDSINISMTETSNQNEYIANVTLKFEGATYFTYRFIVNDNGEWTTIQDDDYHVDLYEKSTENGGNGGSDDNDSTGFEIAILIAAIFAGIMIYRKKR